MAPVSFAKASRAVAVVVYTTTSCPARIRRRVMFPPIRPMPIIPSCMACPSVLVGDNARAVAKVSTKSL